MRITNKQSGFTLVEIIIVISIMGIIGGLSTLIIGRSLDSYAALERRTDLQTSIRLAVERISRELRHALPHSICVSGGAKCALGVASGTGTQFYFIPVKDSGRYQDRPGAYPAAGPILRSRLPVSPHSSDRFDVLSTDGANRLKAAAGDWVTVYNLNNSNIYAGPNNIRNRINKIVLKDIKNTAATTDDIDQIQFSDNLSFNNALPSDQSFSNHSPTRRFHIIEHDKVTLFYLDSGNLYRDTTTFAAPNTATGTPRLLMENVDACTFTYTPGSQQRAGLLRIDITIKKQGEKIQVIHDAHVYNTP